LRWGVSAAQASLLFPAAGGAVSVHFVLLAARWNRRRTAVAPLELYIVDAVATSAAGGAVFFFVGAPAAHRGALFRRKLAALGKWRGALVAWS